MIENAPLNVQIYNNLKEEIISGELKPGEKLNISALAKKWKVSSTPVRDAIHSLATSGFVTIHPRKNVVVSELDRKTFKDIFDLRIALECLAVELSINRIPKSMIAEARKSIGDAFDSYHQNGNFNGFYKVDNLVHRLVLDHCGNEKLVSTMENLQDLISWTRDIVVLQDKAFEKAAVEHIAILELLKDGDTSAAVQAMRNHLSNSCKRTLDNWDIQDK